MIDRKSRRVQQAGEQGVRVAFQNPAIGLTVAILGIMGVAIAIDASSVPSLAFLTIILIGSLIAALVYWG